MKGIGKAGVKYRRGDWSRPLETRAGTEEHDKECQSPCEHVPSGTSGSLAPMRWRAVRAIWAPTRHVCALARVRIRSTFGCRC
jgi:hypothetical protein